MQFAYDYQSIRAQKARFAATLAAKWLRALAIVIVVVVIALLAVGIYFALPVLWLSLLLAWPVIVLGLWYRFELKELAIAPRATRVDDLLDPQLLAMLPPVVSPRQLADLVMQTDGGHFYVVRFGIGPSFLQQLISDQPADTATIWQQAIDIMHTTDGAQLSSTMVAAALIRTCPGIYQILAHLQLDQDDILSGVDWQEHIEELYKKYRQKRLGGGFGRDWAFGYTPLLDQFGTNVSKSIELHGQLVREVEGHQAIVGQMIDMLGSSSKRNVALVGPLGVGKTTLVYAFAEELLDIHAKIPRSLRFCQVISLDAGSLIARAGGRGELEQLVSQLLYEAHSAKNIILCLDGAELFFEEGVGSVNIANVLQPILEGGAIRMIITMDQQRLLQIGQRNPGLVNALNQINVTSPDRDDVIHILQDQLILLEFENKVAYMYQALAEAYRLGDRYMYDLAMPGKAMRLLEAAARFAEKRLVTAASVQQAIEKTVGVKVATASNDDERQKLLGLEDLIHQRMINQTRAVAVVSDALRRARAGVRNLDRPIGTFLFLGPTGVGKTELAKSIAAVYFNGETNMVRLDLNEYVQSNDVTRLIANGATDPHSLTAQISKSPFSVVLLDEIEKAHPDVINTLLQVLDEGVLRDIDNREVSFKDAIIIATSNAGADKIRSHIDAGEQLEQFEDAFVNELIESQLFRPEFLNRFDEIVLFRPLTEDELMQVVDLILVGINKNLALQKVSVSVDDDAKRLLVTTGNDPRLGARPMRRMVQRTVENIVAKRMLSGQVAPGEVIELHLADVQAIMANTLQ